MVIQPIYNILFLPDVTYHFKKEFFTENASEQLEVGSELLFAFLRNEDDAEELDADHICPFGISVQRLMTIRQKKRRLNFSVYVPHF